MTSRANGNTHKIPSIPGLIPNFPLIFKSYLLSCFVVPPGTSHNSPDTQMKKRNSSLFVYQIGRVANLHYLTSLLTLLHHFNKTRQPHNHISLIAAFSSSVLLAWVFLIFLLTKSSRFSMGFRSGKWIVQFSTVMYGQQHCGQVLSPVGNQHLHKACQQREA